MSKTEFDNLVQKISEGDEEAFKSLFQIMHYRLYNFAYSYIKSKELADEVVMDVFMKLWKSSSRVASIKNIEAYLFVSVRNLSYTLLKKESKLRLDPLEEAHVELASYNYTPESSLITEENISSINEAVDSLPPKCKVIFKMIREEGFSKQETAKILDISIKTIDNQIAIAVKKIAEILDIDLSNKNYSSHIQMFLMTL